MADIDASLIEQALEWRAVMDDDDLSAATREAFEVWLNADPAHREAFDYAQRFWAGLGALRGAELDEKFFRRSLKERARATWFNVLRRSADLIAGPAAFVAVGAKGAVWAAVSVVAIGAALVVGRAFISGPVAPVTEQIAEASFATDTAEIRELVLDDGSLVTLGADSALKVSMGEGRRTAVLERGDAFFDVASDTTRPFEVAAGPARVRVTGTRFDVQLDPGTARVSVAEGAVDVAFRGAGSVAAPKTVHEASAAPVQRLTAGQMVMAAANAGLGDVSSVKGEAIGAWRGGRLVYADTSLADVIGDARRYYGGAIVIEDPKIAELTISGSFDATDIPAFLTTLSELFALEVVETREGNIVLRERDG